MGRGRKPPFSVGFHRKGRLEEKDVDTFRTQEATFTTLALQRADCLFEGVTENAPES
jgi:hypothetical protein